MFNKPTLRSVFQNRNLALLWAGQIVSQCGDSIYQIGLIWLVLELSGSETVTGLVSMAAYLPAVLLSLWAGVISDRFDRRRIMLTADAGRAVIILAIPTLHFLGYLNPSMLAITAFILAIGATFFNPARDSFIPLVVVPDRLVQANSLMQTSWQLSLLLGPAFAGGLLHLLGNIHLFTVDSLAYGTSFLLIYLIKPKRQVYKPVNNGLGFGDVREGLSYAVRHPVILPLLLITIADNIFIMGPAIVGTPILVKQELYRGAESYALIQACYAVGMLTGTAALLATGSRFRMGKVLLVGMILDGLTFIPLYFVTNIIQTALVIVVHSLAIPLLTVSRASLIQSIVPQRMTGRVFAMVNLAVVGMTAISSGLTGIACEIWGVRVVFFVIGIGGAACGIVGWIAAKKLQER